MICSRSNSGGDEHNEIGKLSHCLPGMVAGAV